MTENPLMHAARHVPTSLYEAMFEAPRWVLRHPDGSPYLTRWVLEGVDCLENHDQSIPYSMFVHRIHTRDMDLHPHRHPWEWQVAVVLSGGYIETRMRLGPDGVVVSEINQYRTGDVNIIGVGDYHSIVKVEHDTYTLFLCGQEAFDWGFLCGGVDIPHKEYFKRPDAQKMTHARER